jgi:diguanylate cyclase (GGDEF)-like protein
MKELHDPQQLGSQWAREGKDIAELLACYPSVANAELRLAVLAYVTELRRLFEEKALRDALTELRNRAAFEQQLAAELARAARYERVVTLALLDLDGFKRINDTRGHAAGDAALRQFAQCLQASLRQSDWAFRYGGDEFAVLFPETSAHAARVVMERLALRLRAQQCTYGFSWGCATAPVEATDAAALIACADARLYEHKRRSGTQAFVTKA